MNQLSRRRTGVGSIGARVLGYIVLAGLAAALLAESSLNIVDPDIWHEMALARQIFATGQVPDTDPFAYTPTHRFIHHEWGAGVVAYLLAGLGPWAILLLLYAIIAGILAFCLRSAARTGGPAETWGFLALPAMLLLSLGFLPLRAQAYSYLFIAGLLWCLGRDERGDRRWIAPWLAAFPLWVNLHAGCVVGIGFTAAFWLEQALRRKPHRHLLFVWPAMVAMLALSPYGVSYYGYLWGALTMQRPRIAEWLPVWTAPSAYLLAFLACALLMAYGIAAGGRRLLPGVLVVLAAFGAALLHRKMLPIFAVAWLCYVPGYLRNSRLGDRIALALPRWRHIAAAVWLVLILSFCRTALANRFWELRVPANRLDPAASHPVYPAGAVAYLSQNGFSGNVMTSFNYGAYVTWKLHPQVKVSFDSRYEAVYPGWLFDRILDLFDAAPGWQATLAAYPTDLVLVPRVTRLARAIPASGWRRVYSDKEFALYARPGLALPTLNRAGRIPEEPFP